MDEIFITIIIFRRNRRKNGRKGCNPFPSGLISKEYEEKGSEPFNVQVWKRNKKGLIGLLKRVFGIGYKVTTIGLVVKTLTCK